MHTDPMESEEDSTLVAATYVFRGIEYVVTMNVVKTRSTLVVEVEDRLTADQWRGSFDAAYIEDLTHKTGNYKQFSIFVSMLESGLTQSKNGYHQSTRGSDSISLDLLTYADLESLRNRKAGSGTRNIPGGTSTGLNSKRYLILTYTVEFDRIHYPLPLPYMGKPDPRALQETIRQLRHELKLAKQQASKDFRLRELDKLRKDYDRLSAEKEDVEEAFLTFKREVGTTSLGSAAKEVRVLKSMVKSLEEDLMTERNKFLRQSNKRGTEYRQLQDEVEELRATERNLRVRVKSLTNELAVYKRTGRPGSNRSGGSSYLRNDRSSRDNSFTSNRSNKSRNRSTTSRDRSYSRDRSLERSRERSIDRLRDSSVDRFRNRSRNSSIERSRGNRSGERFQDRSREHSRERSLERSRNRSLNGANRSRASSAESYHSQATSPSCAGARYPRFDPTSYVRERQRKQKEADMKQKRHARPGRAGGIEKKPRHLPLSEKNLGSRRSVSRSSSVSSLRSRTSSIESLSDIAPPSDSSNGRQRFASRAKHPKYSLYSKSSTRQPLMPPASSNGVLSSPDDSYGKSTRQLTRKKAEPLASTPDSQSSKTRPRTAWAKENKAPTKDVNDSDIFDRSAEILEIDERLNRLQQFMKTVT